MKCFLYVVRLRQKFRILFGLAQYPHDYPQRIRPAYYRAFPSRTAAEQFIQENQPIDFNPFARNAEEFILRSDDTLAIWGFPAYIPADAPIEGTVPEQEIVYYHGPLSFFQEWLGAVTSIAPPQIPEASREEFDIAVQVFMGWWEANKERLTDAQKAEIWRTLTKDPWEIVEVKTV